MNTRTARVSVVFGVGGWFLGLLVLLATMPGVSLDNQLLAVVSIGIPIGLAVALAWVDRDWPTRTKATGFAAAAAGAFLGAWLGLHATGGLLAFGAAILAAVLGANLPLLALEMARDRQTRVAPPVPRQQRRWETAPQPAEPGGVGR